MDRRTITCPLDISNNASKVNRKDPFFNDVWAEAVIPLENGFPTLRTSTFTSDDNDELLKKSIDLVEERRENAMVQLVYYQHKLKQGYDMNVKLRSLAPGDLVLRKVLGSTKNPAWGKLGGTIPHHIGGRNKCVLLRRFR